MIQNLGNLGESWAPFIAPCSLPHFAGRRFSCTRLGVCTSVKACCFKNSSTASLRSCNVEILIHRSGGDCTRFQKRMKFNSQYTTEGYIGDGGGKGGGVDFFWLVF